MNKPKTGKFYITRSLERSKMRDAISARRMESKGGEPGSNRAQRRAAENKLMRRLWADKQIKKHGKKSYYEMRVACDPRGRHDLNIILV